MNYDANKFSLIDTLLIISRHLRLLIILPCAVALGTGIYVFLKPKIYEGTAVILPAPSSTPGFSLGKLSGLDLSSLGMSMAMGGSQVANLYRYQNIIQSKRVSLNVIEKYDLMTLYKTKFVDDCIKEFNTNLTTDIDEEAGVLTISFKYPEEPQTAAEITNYIVELMKDINKELSTSLALAQKNFIEKRYFEAVQKVEYFEDSLKQFQKEHDIVLIEEQSKITLEAMAELQVKIVENEITYNMLKNELGPNHPKAKAQLSIINELNKQFERINSGMNSKDKFYIAKKDMNDLAFQYLRIRKDLEINYKIQEFLIPQYEMAKITVIKDVPDIQILDYATTPDKKIAPKRILMILFAFLLSTALTVIAILSIEFYNNITSSKSNPEILAEIKSNIKKAFAKKKT